MICLQCMLTVASRYDAPRTGDSFRRRTAPHRTMRRGRCHSGHTGNSSELLRSSLSALYPTSPSPLAPSPASVTTQAAFTGKLWSPSYGISRE